MPIKTITIKGRKMKIFYPKWMEDLPFPELLSYKNLVVKPEELKDINTGEGAKLGGIAEGATATFQIYYQATAPSSGMVVGDYWLDSDDNKLYRYSDSAWSEIQDDDIATAIANAATAQGEADRKIVTFIQAEPPTAEQEGDVWFDSDDNNKPYRWDGDSWNAAEFDVATWAKIIDKPPNLFQIFFQSTAPVSGMSVGDYWIDSDDNKIYRYADSSWGEVQDDEIATAIANAATAQSTADGKVYVFHQDEAPTDEDAPDPPGELTTGDLWFDSNDNNKPYRYSGEAWVDAEFDVASWSKIIDDDTHKPEDDATEGAKAGTNLKDTKGDIAKTFGGDGSDGALNISGSTNIDCGGLPFCIKNYTSISITGVGQLTFSNPAPGGTLIVLKSQGNVIITSTNAAGAIIIGGSSPMGAPGGAGGAAENDGADGIKGLLIIGSENPQGIRGINTVGEGTTTAGEALTLPGLYSLDEYVRLSRKGIFIACGSGGGGGGGSSVPGGAGGAGGGALIIECGGSLNFTGIISAQGVDATAGQAGLPNTYGSAGGGGGAGGMVTIIYNSLIASSGTINTNGGDGGDGGLATNVPAGNAATGGSGAGAHGGPGGFGGSAGGLERDGEDGQGAGAGGGGGGSAGQGQAASTGGSGGGSLTCLVAINYEIV